MKKRPAISIYVFQPCELHDTLCSLPPPPGAGPSGELSSSKLWVLLLTIMTARWSPLSLVLGPAHGTAVIPVTVLLHPITPLLTISLLHAHDFDNDPASSGQAGLQLVPGGLADPSPVSTIVLVHHGHALPAETWNLLSFEEILPACPGLGFVSCRVHSAADWAGVSVLVQLWARWVDLDMYT